MNEVYIWADGSYHHPDDGEPATWKSDDYYVVELPEDLVCIDEFVYEYCNAVDLGSSTNQKTKIN